MSTNELFPAYQISDRLDYERWIIERATEFSTVLFKGRGMKERLDWPSLKEAIDYARPNPRIMVYASMKSGRSTMIAPSGYDFALTIVGRDA